MPRLSSLMILDANSSNNHNFTPIVYATAVFNAANINLLGL